MKKKLKFSNPLIISGQTTSKEIAMKVSKDLRCDNYFLKNNKISSLNELEIIFDSKTYDIIIAIGGGKVLDMAKRFSLLKKINHISIPTVISNDGLISPIAVLKDIHNRHNSLPAAYAYWCDH